MKKYLLLILLIVFSISIISFTNAADVSCKDINFIAPNGNAISNYFVSVSLIDEVNVIDEFMDFNGTITLCDDFNNGNYIFRIKDIINDKNYYSKKVIRTSNKTLLRIPAIPVSSIYGVVLDSYDNLLPGVNLSYQCQKPLLGKFPVKTNSVGAFRIDNLPIGKCIIYSKSNEKIGFSEVDVVDNSIYQTSIVIKEPKKTKISIPIETYFLALIIFIFVLYFINPYKKKTKKVIPIPVPIPTNASSNTSTNAPSNVEQTSTNALNNVEQTSSNIESTSKMVGNIILTTKMNNLMKTFNDTELKIVNLLISIGGCATQSKIRQSTGIPKTSLFRYIKKLEDKRIITTFSIGKMKKIQLSEFFLEKEEN